MAVSEYLAGGSLGKCNLQLEPCTYFRTGLVPITGQILLKIMVSWVYTLQTKAQSAYYIQRLQYYCTILGMVVVSSYELTGGPKLVMCIR